MTERTKMAEGRREVFQIRALQKVYGARLLAVRAPTASTPAATLALVGHYPPSSGVDSVRFTECVLGR